MLTGWVQVAMVLLFCCGSATPQCPSESSGTLETVRNKLSIVLGIAKGDDTCLVFPVHEMNDVDGTSLFVQDLIDIK